MTVIQVRHLSKTFGGRTIFRDLDWSIQENARLGLVGPNGAGKSTILKILNGSEEPSEGQVVKRKGLTVACLPQHIDRSELTPIEIAVRARSEIAIIMEELEAIEARFRDPAIISDMIQVERILDRQARALQQLDRLRASGIEGEARTRMLDLGLVERDLNKPLSALSGGQRKMVLLVACCIRRPDVLLLDEPETHLDLRARSRIEAVIRAFDGAVVIVSHDRYLLDETVSEIALLERGGLTRWPGNYSTFAVQREIALRRQDVLFTTQQKEIERLEEAIRRFKQWASEMPDSANNSRHIKQARQKQHQIDSMEKVERPVLERRKIRLSLHEMHRSGQKVTEMSAVTVSFGSQTVLRDISLEIRRGDRIGVIGPNGAGKTVLAKIVVGQVEPQSGTIRHGPSVRLGYFAQSQENLSGGQTAVELVRLARPLREDEAVAELMKFLFTYEQVRQPVAKLSGGERSRLQLLLLMLSQPNLLVLDEPTNHLDIESMEVLEQALEEFEGSVLVISHDRYFLDRIVDRVVEVRSGLLVEQEGGYSDWLSSIGNNGRKMDASRWQA